MKTVELYTKTTCPYCDRAKALLRHKQVAYQEIRLEDQPDQVETMIARSGGRRTVPQIFIAGQSIGGYDDLKALEEAGKLDGLLAD